MLEEKRLEEENLKKKGRKGKGGETGKRSVSGELKFLDKYCGIRKIFYVADWTSR